MTRYHIYFQDMGLIELWAEMDAENDDQARAEAQEMIADQGYPITLRVFKEIEFEADYEMYEDEYDIYEE